MVKTKTSESRRDAAGAGALVSAVLLSVLLVAGCSLRSGSVEMFGPGAMPVDDPVLVAQGRYGDLEAFRIFQGPGGSLVLHFEHESELRSHEGWLHVQEDLSLIEGRVRIRRQPHSATACEQRIEREGNRVSFGYLAGERALFRTTLELPSRFGVDFGGFSEMGWLIGAPGGEQRPLSVLDLSRCLGDQSVMGFNAAETREVPTSLPSGLEHVPASRVRTVEVQMAGQQRTEQASPHRISMMADAYGVVLLGEGARDFRITHLWGAGGRLPSIIP